MEPVRLATVVPFWLGRPPLDSLEVALNAERQGWPELWMGELATFDAFALAGAVARASRAVRLVVGPLAIGVRDPVGLALGISSVANLGGRTADLALGASTPHLVTAWHGRPWPDNPSLIRDTVPVVRSLLRGSSGPGGFRLRAPFAGGGGPARIGVAGFGPRMLRVARELADMAVLNIVTPAQVAWVRQALGPSTPLTVWVAAALDPGPDAYQQLRRELVGYAAHPGYGEMFAAAGFEPVVAIARAGGHPRQVLAAIPDTMIDAVAAMGNLTAIRSRVAEYHEAGATTVALVPVTAEDPGGARLLSALSPAESIRSRPRFESDGGLPG